jgi:hypothetical protein
MRDNPVIDAAPYARAAGTQPVVTASMDPAMLNASEPQGAEILVRAFSAHR